MIRIYRKTKALLCHAVRICKRNIIHINDSPQRIARGIAIGLFIAWTPAIGTHIVLAVILSMCFRANKVAALVSIWINNPFTMIPMFYPGYLVGRSLMHSFTGQSGLTSAQIMDIFRQFDSVGELLVNFHRAQFWHDLFNIFLRIGLDLWVGCLLLGLLTALIGYLCTLRFILWHRHKRAMTHMAYYKVSLRTPAAAQATTAAHRSQISG